MYLGKLVELVTMACKILPKDLLMAQGRRFFQAPIGTGPFIADANIYNEWVNGQPLQLHKNSAYHPVGNHTGSPTIDNVYLEQFSDENTLVSALEAGEVDLAKFTPYGYSAVANQPHIAEQQALISTNEWNEIAFSQYDSASADKSLNPARWDVNVRRALAMAEFARS